MIDDTMAAFMRGWDAATKEIGAWHDEFKPCGSSAPAAECTCPVGALVRWLDEGEGETP